MGLAEGYFGAYVSTQYRDAFALGLLIAVLLWKPQGLLGLPEDA